MYSLCTKIAVRAVIWNIRITKVYHIRIPSLGPVVNILAIFSYANILKNKRIKIYHNKGIGCPLLISINIGILTKERKNKKEEKNDQTGTQAKGYPYW